MAQCVRVDVDKQVLKLQEQTRLSQHTQSMNLTY